MGPSGEAAIVSVSSPIKFIRISRTAMSPAGPSINISEIQAYDVNDNIIPTTIAMYGPSGEGPDGFPGHPSGLAVDGNLRSFAHTADKMESFLQVGFPSDISISKLVIYPRHDFKNRMIGTRVEFFNGAGDTAAPLINITSEREVYNFRFKTIGNKSLWEGADSILMPPPQPQLMPQAQPQLMPQAQPPFMPPPQPQLMPQAQPPFMLPPPLIPPPGGLSDLSRLPKFNFGQGQYLRHLQSKNYLLY